MPKKNYQVFLTDDDITVLNNIRKNGHSSAKTIMHANILLNTNDSFPEKKKSNRELSEIFGVSLPTVNKIRKTYCEEGLAAALNRKTRLTPETMSKITGEFEAHVIATALSPPPKGYAKWNLRLLAEHCMEKKYIVSISHTAVGTILNTNQLKPHLSKYWCIPKENDPYYAASMEDILTIYQKEYNPSLPVVCMDEKPVQLLGEIRERISAKPMETDPETDIQRSGSVQKIDSEYIRMGTASIFMFTEPLSGWRHTEALEHRTMGDFAKMMKNISETYYPDVTRIILVADNLNTHCPGSFYAAFPPETAWELMQKFEFHYTPKHGSWLNIAETELGSLSMQCLGNQRIPKIQELNEMPAEWERDRNQRQKGVNWQFTTKDARVKLKRLYPTPIFEN